MSIIRAQPPGGGLWDLGAAGCRSSSPQEQYLLHLHLPVPSCWGHYTKFRDARDCSVILQFNRDSNSQLEHRRVTGPYKQNITNQVYLRRTSSIASSSSTKEKSWNNDRLVVTTHTPMSNTAKLQASNRMAECQRVSGGMVRNMLWHRQWASRCYLELWSIPRVGNSIHCQFIKFQIPCKDSARKRLDAALDSFSRDPGESRSTIIQHGLLSIRKSTY